MDLFDNDDKFWTNETILDLNYGKVNYRDNILPDIKNISYVLQELKDKKKSVHGVERQENKNVFDKHHIFFELMFKHWVNNCENDDFIEKFYLNLNIMFKKVAEFHGINPKDWIVEYNK